MSDERLSDDFKQLGENLTEMLRAAWDRPERKAVKIEIERGLSEVGLALNRAVNDMSESEVGVKMKTEVEEIKTRVQSGEVEELVRSDVKTALKSMNAELEKLIEKIKDVAEDPDKSDVS